ncbi:MAG: prephenate dehydratase [Methylococcales bacterium]|nr:prephenate dehydratase [Methylococcales bacterium]
MTDKKTSDIIPLPQLRQQIDSIDQQILALLNQRANCAMEVAKTKISEGEMGNFYRPDREALVLRGIRTKNSGPLADDTVVSFFREVMSACLALEKPLDVAFLGPEGTFTQQAAFKHFGHAIQTQPYHSISDVFESVETEHCQFGIVPVENSTEGVIAHTLDRFLVSSLKICGEVEIKVHQNLMGKIDDYSKITEVLSHPQSLAQCRQWLDQNLPNARRIETSSNAEAAQLIQQTNDHKVAIAGKIAADLYGLNILEKNIEDVSNNTTRFIIIGQQQPESTGDDKTSLVLSIGNQSGSLHKILEPFAEYGISMSHIESRPSRQGLWDYVFFVDIDGHQADEKVAIALTRLKTSVTLLNILGSYPKAVI